METRHIEEQANIILDHLRNEQVDPAFVLRHAEVVRGFAFSADLKRDTWGAYERPSREMATMR